MLNSNHFIQVYLFIIFILVCSCTTPASYKSVNLNFENVSSLKLDVSEFQIINQYVMPMKKPNIEHLLLNAPSDVVIDYLRHKFVSSGEKKRAKIIIKEASIVEKVIIKKSLYNAILMNEKETSYSGKIYIRIEFLSERGFIETYSNFESVHKKIIIGELTLNNVQQIYFEILEGLIRGLDLEIDDKVPSYFSEKLL